MSKICLMCGETFADAMTFCPRDGSALRAAVRGDDLIGELFCERYVATDLLGSGGMGAVYLARDVRLPQQVAIKVLHDRGNADATLVARFRQEAESASRINHDRVARVYDFGFMPDGRAYIVMEYVGGQTLKKWMEERGALGLAECTKITEMVAEGLEAAHKLGIVHRDLKPENVMIVDDADAGIRVKVLDFGIAKVLQSDNHAEYTAPGFVIGTPLWMSPEQILGTPLDARSDVFALGLLVYAMLTGRRAYTGATDQEEMLARISAPPTPLAEVRPDLAWPVGLQAFITRALSPDPNTRPSTAMAFARELGTFAAKALTPIETPVVPTPKRPFAAVIGASALVLVVVSVVAVKLLNGPATTPSKTRNGDSTVQRPRTETTTVSPKLESLTTPGIKPVDNGVAGRDAEITNSKTPKDKENSRPPTDKNDPKLPTDVKPPPSSGEASDGVDAAVQLDRLIAEVPEEILRSDQMTESQKLANAKRRVFRLNALVRRLRSRKDSAAAFFYLGSWEGTLGNTEKACALFTRSMAIGTDARSVLEGLAAQRAALKCQ